MPPDSTVVAYFWDALPEWIEFAANIVTVLSGSGLLGLIFYGYRKFRLSRRAQKRSQLLEQRIGAELYFKGIIEQAIRYYVEPHCQSIDPSGGEEPRLVLATKQKLFSTIDEALNNPTEYRYIFLLADSGMGKTSFLINYYARNLFHRHKLDIVLLPLGIPDLDRRIEKVDNQQNKILFLDAFDEDTLAIVDHVERLRTLLALTRQFKKILITCRTQFFPTEQEIPRETGIVKIGPRAAGEKAQYDFHKLYLSPFSDAQVNEYLKQRYPFFQLKQRKKAKKMVRQIPNLIVRPMLLAHIQDLVKTEREIKYAFQLYEEMIEAWLVREEGIVEGIKKELLRKFSECLALDLFLYRKERGAERVPKETLKQITEKFNIPLEDWQLTGRSLLNRDAVGNYKFAHRSIMEYLFVKRFLELKPEERFKISWTDQMKKFLKEIVDCHREDKKKFPDLTMVDLDGIGIFRTKPAMLSSDQVKMIIQAYDFFDSNKNKNGKGFKNRFEAKIIKGDKIVFDRVSDLMWQQCGSSNYMNYNIAKKYVDELNKKSFAGLKGWRLPTLEEAMSLMKPKQNKEGFYIDPIFDVAQQWIWTSDPVYGASRAWVIYFAPGGCGWSNLILSGCVRAVRSGQSSTE